ncbi:hypothetical protein EDF41_0488 [Curtobacterium sp. PhB171]|nr:hypothetical protein EDF41_0488 [Curtobacterium sp. PhB171]ROQ29300.1 hypothetical protein EDF40_0536 [Curtobacterium sp. PhB170]ROS45555.1 hypothetical protein EDF25_0313 [Curtobacterium sp. PhB131]ROS68142.1 hypothetical protein EDF30_2482 [Curtobacterium sp. PhB141]
MRACEHVCVRACGHGAGFVGWCGGGPAAVRGGHGAGFVGWCGGGRVVRVCCAARCVEPGTGWRGPHGADGRPGAGPPRASRPRAEHGAGFVGWCGGGRVVRVCCAARCVEPGTGCRGPHGADGRRGAGPSRASRPRVRTRAEHGAGFVGWCGGGRVVRVCCAARCVEPGTGWRGPHGADGRHGAGPPQASRPRVRAIRARAAPAGTARSGSRRTPRPERGCRWRRRGRRPRRRRAPCR